MSTTNYLNLNKHDNPATNEEQFDVEKYLNTNWDKVDNELSENNLKKIEQETEIKALETDNTTNKQNIELLQNSDNTINENIKNVQEENEQLKSQIPTRKRNWREHNFK